MPKPSSSDHITSVHSVTESDEGGGGGAPGQQPQAPQWRARFDVHTWVAAERDAVNGVCVAMP